MNTCPISLKYNEVLNRIRRVDRHSAARGQSQYQQLPRYSILTYLKND